MPRLRSAPDNQPHTGSLVGPECPTSFADDCWRWRGLGKSKARVWSFLGSEPVRPSDLAQSLGVGVRTVQGHLRQLEMFGLAARVEGSDAE